MCAYLNVCVSVCLCAPPLLSGPESSTQLNSECALRPHIVPHFYEGASLSILSVLSGRKAACVTEEVVSYQSTLNCQHYAAQHHPLSRQSAELPSNKKERRGGARAGSTVSLICQEGRCQGSTASVGHYYWRGLSEGGQLMTKQGAS